MTAESSRDDVLKSTKSLSGSPGEMSVTSNYPMVHEAQDSLNCPHWWPVWVVHRTEERILRLNGTWQTQDRGRITYSSCPHKDLVRLPVHSSLSQLRIFSLPVASLQRTLFKLETCWLTNGFYVQMIFSFEQFPVARIAPTARRQSLRVLPPTEHDFARLEHKFRSTHSIYFCN